MKIYKSFIRFSNHRFSQGLSLGQSQSHSHSQSLRHSLSLRQSQSHSLRQSLSLSLSLRQSLSHSQSLRQSLSILIFILITLSSCKKDELEINNTPQIELINAGPNTVKEMEDSIWFEINYKDGNGDLGENNTDENNLWVTDPRINVKYEFRIKQLVPNNSEVPISGILRFSISNTVITNNQNSESVQYKIQLKDRAGNYSNEIICPPINIIK